MVFFSSHRCAIKEGLIAKPLNCFPLDPSFLVTFLCLDSAAVGGYYDHLAFPNVIIIALKAVSGNFTIRQRLDVAKQQSLFGRPFV